MWQTALIAIAVTVATGYVIWSFLSLVRRQWLLDAFASHGLLTQWASRHRAKLALPGCAACTSNHAPRPRQS
jgi:hypothetical protein